MANSSADFREQSWYDIIAGNLWSSMSFNKKLYHLGILPMTETTMELLYRPDSAELAFLPEGPYPLDEHRFSWVAIQHSATATSGSLNVFDWETKLNTRYRLPGRPGFAFPTMHPGKFVIGLERHITLFDSANNTYEPLSAEIDAHVSGTVINDGVAFAGGVLFGCKDLKFAEKKAGLYLWRTADRATIPLRNDQICSNGKVILGEDNQLTVLDIDTPTKTVVRYRLDVAEGKLSEPELALDLRSLDFYPDGMIATPDGSGVIISFYNPGDAPAGETRQYRLSNGECEAVWKTPLSPQATCPQLVRYGGQVRLIVTTAVEHMSPERLAKYPQAGCLFTAVTDFTSLPSTPVVKL
jgi:sugar lactone lactonase YvrE